MSSAFAARYGPWALVTGATHGIGAEIARLVASRGLDLVLVADDGPGLARAAARLGHEHGVRTRTACVDLASRGFLDDVLAATRDIDVGLLVCNAGHSPVGLFLEAGIDEGLRAVDVNARSSVALVHAYGRPMCDRRRGGIVLVSSMAGLQGSALVAAYAATKAFQLVLAEGLWEELRHHGVDVLASCPGPTRTPTWEAGAPRVRPLAGPRVMEPEGVAAETLDALGRGPAVVIGRLNRVGAALLSRLLPRRLATRLVGRAMRALYPHAGLRTCTNERGSLTPRAPGG